MVFQVPVNMVLRISAPAHRAGGTFRIKEHQELKTLCQLPIQIALNGAFDSPAWKEY
jgi:hypothetical protein